jgi:membrane-associated phospholipid phosphatase
MIKKLFLVILLFPTLNLWSQNADIDILKYVNLNRNHHLDNMFRGFTNSAGPVAFGVPILLIGISLARKDSLTLQKSLYLGASVVSSAIISNILKYAVNRPRPFVTYPFLEKVTSGGSPSFPSGHTSDAFSIATSLSIAYPKWYVIIPSYAWAGVVAYSRMDLGVHYPSDVLAGAIIGAGSAYLCYKGQQWLAKKRKR